MANVFTEGSKVWAPDDSVAWEEGVVGSVDGDSITVSVGADPKKQKQVRSLTGRRDCRLSCSRTVLSPNRRRAYPAASGPQAVEESMRSALATSIVELQFWL